MISEAVIDKILGIPFQRVTRLHGHLALGIEPGMPIDQSEHETQKPKIPGNESKEL